jgi:hypothetical protein
MSRTGLVVLVLLAAVAGGLYVGGSMYARSGGWFVGESNGKVTVFEGQPGGFLFFSPGIAETDVDIATLTDQAREDLQDKQDIAFESEDQAREFIGMISVAALSGVETTEDTQDLLNDIGGSPDSGTATEKPTGTAGEEQPAPSTARSTTTTTPDDQENGT